MLLTAEPPISQSLPRNFLNLSKQNLSCLFVLEDESMFIAVLLDFLTPWLGA